MKKVISYCCMLGIAFYASALSASEQKAEVSQLLELWNNISDPAFVRAVSSGMTENVPMDIQRSILSFVDTAYLKKLYEHSGREYRYPSTAWTSLSHNKKKLAVLSARDKQISIFDLESGKVEKKISIELKRYSSLVGCAFGKDDQSIIVIKTNDEESYLTYIDLVSRSQQMGIIPLPTISAFDVSNKGSIALISPVSGLLQVRPGIDKQSRNVQAASFSTSTTLRFDSTDERIALSYYAYDVITGQQNYSPIGISKLENYQPNQIKEIKKLDGRIASLAWSPTGNRIAAVSSNEIVLMSSDGMDIESLTHDSHDLRDTIVMIDWINDTHLIVSRASHSTIVPLDFAKQYMNQTLQAVVALTIISRPDVIIHCTQKQIDAMLEAITDESFKQMAYKILKSYLLESNYKATNKTTREKIRAVLKQKGKLAVEPTKGLWEVIIEKWKFLREL